LQRSEILGEFASLPAACLLCTDVAARGLDIPDVHWIFQLDAPQNPSNFVHRCGRTARMGRSGNALCLLLPHEDCYAELLANRDVPMTERTRYDVDGSAMAEWTRSLVEKDRDLMEKSTKAFVSYVRGYKEHQCKFIFQLTCLDMNHLGRMFGVLRLPVMKEVRGCSS
jgi:ATP-dependent RNA helicase DDX55/SPB4